jgi:hypothetical protein
MAAAHLAGDAAGVEQIREYLVQEGSTSSAERAQLDESTRAMVLMQHLMTAHAEGDQARVDAVVRQLFTDFSPEMVAQVRNWMLFAAGREQGWLPERDYDALAAQFPETGELADQFREIRRGRPV